MDKEAMKKYCGDCINLRLKRDKGGRVTGEHICIVWDNQYRSEWQSLECSSFIDKSSYLKLPEDSTIISKRNLATLIKKIRELSKEVVTSPIDILEKARLELLDLEARKLK